MSFLLSLILFSELSLDAQQWCASSSSFVKTSAASRSPVLSFKMGVGTINVRHAKLLILFVLLQQLLLCRWHVSLLRCSLCVGRRHVSHPSPCFLSRGKGLMNEKSVCVTTQLFPQRLREFYEILVVASIPYSQPNHK